ncbi:MAG: amidase family protein, partial [Caldimicrobium sp.]
EAIYGKDEYDSTSFTVRKEKFTKLPSETIIGIPKEFFIKGLDKEVERVMNESIEKIENNGFKIKEISLPHTKYAVATYYIIAPAEASSNLARYDGIKYGYRASSKGLLELYKKSRSEGFGKEVKRRIMLGTYALSAGYYDAYYLKAAKVRTLIREDFEKAFIEVDLLIGPTTPTLPFRLGEKISDPLQMYLSDIFTIPINLAGVPALSLPIALSREGLPISAQIIGPSFCDERVLTLSYQIERELSLKLLPPLLLRED